MSAPQVICLLGNVETFPSEGKVLWVTGQDDAERDVPGSVRKIVVETPLQRPLVAKDIAWSLALESLSCQAAPGWEEMQKQIEECHLAAHLLLSEVADFGLEAFATARENWREHASFRDFYSLQGSFSKVPAVICGAGSSLQEAAPFLKEMRAGAFLIAAGSAFAQLAQLGIVPHAVCALDKQMIPPSFVSSTPLFMQSRLNPAVVSCFRGEKILVPESGPLNWERWWLEREYEVPSFGWTVGNFALTIALWLGCDPIILTGMDYCYHEGKKYALDQEAAKTCSSLIQVKNRLGEEAFTQRDWLMAARFCEEVLAAYPKRSVISTAVHGLSLGGQIEVLPFSELPKFDLRKIELEQVLKKTPYVALQNKEKEWQESQQRCWGEEDLSEEPFYEVILKPLWNIWRPLFAAEGQNIELHQKLFFEQVLAAYQTQIRDYTNGKK